MKVMYNMSQLTEDQANKLIDASDRAMATLTRLLLNYGYILPSDTTEEIESVLNDLSSALDEAV